MKPELKAKILLEEFGADAYDLADIKRRELLLQANYWESVMTHILEP